MSLDAMLAVMKLPAGRTTTSERLLLLAMAESASEDGELSAYCRSQAFLAFKCGWVNVGAVRKLLRSVERKGLVEVIENGAGRGQSSYRLTFIETSPPGSLAKVFRGARASESRPLHMDRTPALFGPGETAPYGADHISVVSTSQSHEKPARSRGLKKWFNEELWPRFPEPVDRLNTWRAIEHLNPGGELRAEILAGLERAIEYQERVAAESSDGFMPALPLPSNWVRGRRWEDHR